jgi:hypothetical protein
VPTLLEGVVCCYPSLGDRGTTIAEPMGRGVSGGATGEMETTMSSKKVLRQAMRLLCAAVLFASPEADAKRIEVPLSVPAAPADTLVGKVQTSVTQDSGQLLRMFRSVHDGTQVGRVEAMLAGSLAIELLALGFGVELGLDGTEVVGILRNGDGPTLVYRVDTGADPVAPERGRGNAGLGRGSPAAVHLCGPDAQVVWMLGVARALTRLRSEWAGTFVLVAQPTRLLARGAPSLRDGGQLDGGRLPRADFVVALHAAAAPIGSVLAIRGQPRSGADAVDISVSRSGGYADPPLLEGTPQLATATTQRYGLPSNAPFVYLLVGVSGGLAGEAPPRVEAEPAARNVTRLDLSAIALGAKLGAVAVFELLRAPPGTEQRKGSGLGWSVHHY